MHVHTQLCSLPLTVCPLDWLLLSSESDVILKVKVFLLFTTKLVTAPQTRQLGGKLLRLFLTGHVRSGNVSEV